MLSRIVRGMGSGVGVGLGLGLALAAAVGVGNDLRPVIKGAVKGGVALSDLATVLAARTRENAEDVYHEARAERDRELAAREMVRSDPGDTVGDDVVVIPVPANRS